MNTEFPAPVKLSTAWIAVMLNMVFADILTLMIPGELKKILDGNTEVPLSQELLLIFAIILEIPISMIFLSRILPQKLNRWINITAALLTILFVIGGGSLFLHYYFFATMEIILLLAIMYIAFTWKVE